MFNKKAQVWLRILGFGAIILGGAVVSFGREITIQAIGGIMISIGVAIATLAN